MTVSRGDDSTIIVMHRDATEADVDLHTAVFREAIGELIGEVRAG